jgi:GT2 family glycosyltransferase
MIGLIIPVLNPGKLIADFIDRISAQSMKFDKIVIIDSSSTDGSVNEFKKIGATIYKIDRHEFDHGGTRQLGVTLMTGMDKIVFLTQDALLANKKSIENLVSSFDDNIVGAAYGRQIPHEGAHPIEAHARYFNYPNGSIKKGLDDVPKLGIKTVFISNSFAAYRSDALQTVGGFPPLTIFGEDTYVAAKMIQKGWKIDYCASAEVYHSHNFSYTQEFRRYFDIGVFHTNEKWISNLCGQPTGEGLRFAKSEFNFLWNRNKKLIPCALVRSLAKWLGYKLGTVNAILPSGLRVRFSNNLRYWKKISLPK